MKINELYSWATNPFIRIAGWQAFAIGIVILAITGYTGTLANIYFDGAIDMHFTDHAIMRKSFSYLIIDLLGLVLTLSIAGIIITKSFRLLDILGTVALSKAPFVLLSVTAMFATAPSVDQITQNPTSLISFNAFTLVLILSVPVIIWHIILLYNAFKVSTGAKGSKTTVAFILAMLSAEIITKTTIYFVK